MFKHIIQDLFLFRCVTYISYRTLVKLKRQMSITWWIFTTMINE